MGAWADIADRRSLEGGSVSSSEDDPKGNTQTNPSPQTSGSLFGLPGGDD